MKRRVLFLINDLVTAAGFSFAAMNNEIDFCWAKSRSKALEELSKNHFDLIIVELQAYILQPFEFGKYVKMRDYGSQTPLVGFYQEEKRLTLQEAADAGFDKIFSKDELNTELKELLNGEKNVEILKREVKTAEITSKRPPIKRAKKIPRGN